MGKKKDNRPPIFVAIDKGQDELVEELLKDEPGNRDLRNTDGWTPLIAAAYCGEHDIVELLLRVGADIKATCRDGDTALHYASAQGHLDIIELLAKKGAPLELKDKDGETPYNVAGKNLKVSRATRSTSHFGAAIPGVHLMEANAARGPWLLLVVCFAEHIVNCKRGSHLCGITPVLVRKLIQELIAVKLNDNDGKDDDDSDGDEGEDDGWEEVDDTEAAQALATSAKASG